MIWAIKENQEEDRKHIPYGRLLSEIFYQGGLLNVLRQISVVSDEHLGTITGKFINGRTLRYMGIVKKFIKRESDLKESQIVSDLMVDFPPISKQDNSEVLASYVTIHYERTGEIINYSSIPETQVGAPLIIASKTRKSKKVTSEADEESEPKPKKQKKAKKAPQLNVATPSLPAIQEEIADLELIEVLDKRTRSGTSVATTLQPKPKTQKRRTVRKLKLSTYTEEEDAKVEADSSLVS